MRRSAFKHQGSQALRNGVSAVVAARYRRRGVASILSMMFMVIFGSLAAAMAVVAHGNMRVAGSSIQVNRAMSAAETGLVFAVQRLENESSQFIVSKGVIDAGFAERLWMGTYTSSDGTVESPGGSGYGIIHAVRDAHLADAHSVVVSPNDQNLPEIDADFGILRARPIALEADDAGLPDPDRPHFRLKYELLCSDPNNANCHPDGGIRVTSQGIDDSVKRTLQVDFRITKRIEYAVLSPSRIMIGKNVMVEGPIGSLFGTEPGELTPPHGHPLRMHSDFYHLDPSLSASIDQYFAMVQQYDVAGDNRLRPNHPTESQGTTNFDDVTGNGFVDEFDLFLNHYTSNGTAVYDGDLSGGTPNFADDLQLARLIDLAIPDRDGDGNVTSLDTLLGYEDGKLDAKDRYAKVRGRLVFAVSRDEWESSLGIDSYQEVVQGPIRPGVDQSPVKFAAGEDELRAITTDMFDNSSDWFTTKAFGQSGSTVQEQRDNFVDHVLNSSGDVICPHPSLISAELWRLPVDEAWWYEPLCENNPNVIYYHHDPDTFANADEEGDWEGVPYGANPEGGVYDYYLRPIFRDITFTNIVIPRGTNALFDGCTFVGVTYVDTHPENGHEYWNIAGQTNSDGVMMLCDTDDGFCTTTFLENGDGDQVPNIGSRIHSNNVRFHDCTFLGSISGEKPEHYTHWRNKVQMTGETRFFLDPSDDELLAQPDAAQLISHLNSLSENDHQELAKSSILMPGWSMDVGSFTSDPDATDAPSIQLRGTIVAGLLDVRGNADVHGTLLMTFRPKAGEHPLMSFPDCDTCLGNFSTTIGYFGPDFGDKEGMSPDDPEFDGFGEIRLRYNPDAALPDGIPWPIRVDPMPFTYNEGGSI